MNKKILFTIAPMLLIAGALIGCNPGSTNKEVSKIEAETTIKPATYYAGDEFSKADLNVVATYSDGSFGTLKEDEYTISEDMPYTFKDSDAPTKKFTVSYSGKSCDVDVTVKTSEEKFYNVYKVASKAFQESTYVYDASDITYTYNGTEKAITTVTYQKSDTEKVRFAHINASGDTHQIAGGDELTYFDDETKGIKAYISSLIDDGGTVTFTNDIDTGECSFLYDNPEKSTGESYKFNKNGYVTEIKFKSNQKEEVITLTYNGEPHESAEDKFYKVYKKASDAFQKSTLVYDKYDIGYKYNETSVDVASVTYSTTENERSAIMKVAGTITIGGGDLTYYDDEDKGIRAYIKYAIEHFGLDKVEYTSDSETGTCGFTLIRGSKSLPINFNKDGYATVNEGGVITYTGNAHKEEVSVNCPYDTEQSKYISKSSTTLGTREVLNAIFSEDSMSEFDTIECPDFTLGYGTDDCDVRVETIYLDSDGTEATYETDYTVANNKITFTSARSSYTSVVLKATNASGVADLNVNAYKAS